jgi:hypothetical protein
MHPTLSAAQFEPSNLDVLQGACRPANAFTGRDALQPQPASTGTQQEKL